MGQCGAAPARASPGQRLQGQVGSPTHPARAFFLQDPFTVTTQQALRARSCPAQSPPASPLQNATRQPQEELGYFHPRWTFLSKQKVFLGQPPRTWGGGGRVLSMTVPAACAAPEAFLGSLPFSQPASPPPPLLSFPHLPSFPLIP